MATMPAQFLFVLNGTLMEWLAGSEHITLIAFQLFIYVFQYLPVEHIACASGVLLIATCFALHSAFCVRFIYGNRGIFLEDQANGRYLRTPIFLLLDIVLLTIAANGCTSAVKLAACDFLWAFRQIRDGVEAADPGCEAHAFEKALRLTKLMGWVLHAHVGLAYVIYELLMWDGNDLD